MRGILKWLGALGALAASQAIMAAATTYDFYLPYATKGSFCTVIGAACAADSDFDSGFFQNPASMAVGNEVFDFDFDFNLNGHGNREPSSRESTIQHSFMGALAYRWGRLSTGLSLDQQIYQVDSQATQVSTTVVARASWLNVPLAYKVSQRLALGLTISAVAYTESTHSAQALAVIDSGQTVPSWTLSGGAIYRLDDGLYVGSWLRLPGVYHFAQRLSGTAWNFNNQEDLYFPLQSLSGLMWTPAGSRLTWAWQVDVIGTTPEGHLSSFDQVTSGLSGATPAVKGQTVTINPHVGLRGPWGGGSPWNFFAGAYYAAARTEGVSGRTHLTGGISYKLPLPYEWLDGLEFMAGLDVARDYSEVILTFR